MKGSADEHVRPFHLRPPLPPGFPTFATCGPLTDFDVTLHGNPRQAVLCKYNESTACREDALWPRNKGLLGATRLSMDLPTLAAPPHL
jgi:hypothetical protein